MEGTSPYIKDISTAEFQQEVLLRSREIPVLVDFWAQWCEPCKTLSPLLERITIEATGRFELAKVDVDANPELSAQFGVQSIPTVVAIRNSKEVSRFSGALPEASILTFIDSIMPTELDLMVEEARTALVSDDATGAEHMLRQVLEQKPDHQEAGTSLAALLIDKGETDEAMIVLGKLIPDADVERLQSAARLRQSAGVDMSALETAVRADPTNDRAQLELARALAAHSEFEPALDRMLEVVKRKGEGKEEARLAMVDIFGVLGSDHPLTATYRRQLATALF
ncbi:MAG: thioredoxin [Acidimicrobiia bacterium]|nr:MAG: thioredoxin [Acidimicrobiia bacterium]